MRKTDPNLLERARVLRLAGYSFREIAERVPGLSSSVAHRAARNVPILRRQGKGWPDCRGWREEPAMNYGTALAHRILSRTSG